MDEKSKTVIKIKHQITHDEFLFKVENAANLKNKEVKNICKKMNVTAIFVNRKYYSL